VGNIPHFHCVWKVNYSNELKVLCKSFDTSEIQKFENFVHYLKLGQLFILSKNKITSW
jgi:hypothetical protein